MRSIAVAAAVLSATIAAPCFSSAQPVPSGATVVVAGHDHELTSALDGALAVFSPRLIATDDAPSANESLLVTSRRIGAREHAHFVIWLVTKPTATTIAVYDVTTDQLRERALPFTAPLDAAAATEAARAARTMIRTESLGRSAPRIPALAIAETRRPPPPRPQRFAVVMEIGARRDGESAIGAALVGRPDRAGWIAAVELVHGDLDGAGFAGRLSDRVAVAGARLPVSVARLRGYLIGGLAAHLTAVDGELMDGTPVTDRRIDPALHGAIGIGYAVRGDVEVSLALGSDVMLRRPRYLVADGEVGIVPRIQLSAGLTLAIRLP